MSMISPQVLAQVAAAHKAGQKVVLVTGVFDLLHQEHRNFLEKAKAAGDFLLVCLESDARVKAMKGPDRPKQAQAVRAAALQKLPYVDAVAILPDDFASPAQHDALIKEVLPAILAVSSHSPHLDKKQAILAKYGGNVQIVHQHNPEISTTLKIAQLKKH